MSLIGSARTVRAPARLAWSLGLLLLVATTSACSDPTSGADPSPSSSGSPTSPASATPSASGSPSSAPTPVVDPEHSVPPPGPLTGPLVAPDMLIYQTDPLSADTIARIKKLKGIADVESLSMANVSIENRVINVAAVDPATYRRFTPANSAQLDEEWQRVAGGELAITQRLGKRVQSADGYLQLGNDKDAPRVHIGAFAPQIENAIDAVVNDKWGETLGMTPGNALLIYTGITSPQSVRKSVERIAGAKASVQSLDAVARYGIDITAQQTAFLVGSVADAVGTFNYTVLGGGRIAPDPAWVASHIATENVPILGDVTCNKLLFPQLRAALQEVVTQHLADRIHPDQYAGCYNARFIAGTTKLSNHSFGLALDLNVPENQRGTVGQMDRAVVAIFQKWGFTWGGDWHYTDPMHFEMNALIHPR
jgi:hypothetical protein